MIEVKVPDELWPEDEEEKTGSIVMWLYKDGSTVEEGDILAEFLIEKVTVDVPSPASGVLRIKVEPETVVEKDDVIAVIED